jgi:hypothetical protein
MRSLRHDPGGCDFGAGRRGNRHRTPIALRATALCRRGRVVIDGDRIGSAGRQAGRPGGSAEWLLAGFRF